MTGVSIGLAPDGIEGPSVFESPSTQTGRWTKIFVRKKGVLYHSIILQNQDTSYFIRYAYKDRPQQGEYRVIEDLDTIILTHVPEAIFVMSDTSGQVPKGTITVHFYTKEYLAMSVRMLKDLE